MIGRVDTPVLIPRIQTALDWIAVQGRFGMATVAVLNGVILSRAFSPLDLWPLAFICFPVLLAMVWHSRSALQAFVRAWWTGIGFFAVGLSWIGHSFQMQGPNPGVPPELAPFAVFGLSAFLSLYLGIAAGLARRLTKPGLWGALVFAACWTLMEILRGTLFTGFPWHLISSVWVNWLAPLQSLYWLSSYGLSLVTVFAAAATTTVFHRTGWFGRTVGPAISVLVVAGLFGVGQQRLADTPISMNPTVSLRVVQPNITQRELYVRSRWSEYFTNQLQLSRGPGKTGRAENISLVIWPETSVRGLEFDRENSVNRWQVGQMLEWNAYAIVGGARYAYNDSQEAEFFNSMMVVSADGKIEATYDKHHLVPFGEYLPLSALFAQFGLQHLTGGGAFTPGPLRRNMALGHLPAFSPLICYEVVFPGEAVVDGNRPDWLLTITNDGWFGSTEGPHQHLGLARMRAVEEGLPLVRSAITGISAVIDPLGRTIDFLPVGARGVIDSDLPDPLSAPISTKTRIYITSIFCLIVILIALIWRKISSIRSK